MDRNQSHVEESVVPRSADRGLIELETQQGHAYDTGKTPRSAGADSMTTNCHLQAGNPLWRMLLASRERPRRWRISGRPRGRTKVDGPSFISLRVATSQRLSRILWLPFVGSYRTMLAGSGDELLWTLDSKSNLSRLDTLNSLMRRKDDCNLNGTRPL